MPNRTASNWSVARHASSAAPRASACRRVRSTASISSPCTRPRGEAIERARAGGGPDA